MDQLGAVSTVSIQPSALSGSQVGANMQVGDQVNGQVLQGQNGQFLLNINGQTVTAQSDLQLNPGDLLQLEFQGLTEGLLALRLLTINRSLAFAPLTLDDLSAELASLQLPVNDTTMALAQSMAEFGIPVTKENVQQLLQALDAQPNDATMQAASFLMNAEIPVTPDNLQALANFFLSKPELGTYLAQLQNLTFSGDMSGGLAQLLAILPGVLGEYLLDPKTVKSKNINRMEQLAELAGMKKKEGSTTLSSLLSQLRQEIDEKDSDDSDKGNLQSLSTTLSRIEELVQGEHVLNADNRTDSFLYFQVPVNFSGEKVTAQVRIQYEKDEKGRRIVHADKTRVEFAVTTPNMGAVHCNLDLFNRKIAAKLFVDESRENFIESHLVWLKEAVEKLRYKISSVKISTDPHDFWNLPKTEWKSLERVNVKV